MRHAITTWLGCSLGLGIVGTVDCSRPGLEWRSSSHTTPTAQVQNGSYSGIYSSGYNQDFFLGLPYAQTAQRFRQSQHLNSSWSGIHAATAYPPHCVGFGGDDVGYELSEDCLYLNVIRPSGISPKAGLPVAVWIHGGGLYMGGSADKRYNLTFIVQNSVEQGTPMLAVSLNYRLSAFGFLSGTQAQDAGITNIGFRDQRLALRWIHENIAAFGGDPAKVVIWGESSGAESVNAQAFAYNGRDDGLFRGVIAQSGFGGVLGRYAGGLNATGSQQATFDSLVTNTSCASKVGTAAVIDCLRSLPLTELTAVLNITSNPSAPSPWPPVLDGDFIADYPYNQLKNGRFVRVPVLIGANSDEGTAAVSGTFNTTDDVREAIASEFGLDGTAPVEAAPTVEEGTKLVDQLLSLYPDIQAVGIPGLDKFPVIVPGDAVATALGLQYRRAGAVFGDKFMHWLRRRANLAWSAYGVPSWSYRFDVQVNGLPVQYGATHFQEVAFVFYNLAGLGYATNPFGNEPPTFARLAKTMSTTWVNFVTGLDPNGQQKQKTRQTLLAGEGWPVYNATTGGGLGKNIVWAVNGSYIEPDTYRAEGINWMIEHGLDVLGV